MPSATTSRRTGCITNRGLMYKGWFTKIFGTQFQRELKRIRPIVDAVHRHEERLKTLSDGELQGQTPKLRGLIAERTSALAAEVERLKREKHDCPDADQRVELSQKLSQAAAPTSSLSTTTSPVVTRSGWATSSRGWASPSAASTTRSRRRPSAGRPICATSRTARTTSSASTTCATTWCSRWSSASSGGTP